MAHKIFKSLGFVLISEFIMQILGKFSGATERLLSDSVDKLNLKRVCSVLFFALSFD